MAEETPAAPTETPPPQPEPEPDPPDDQLTDRELRYKREAVARRRETRAAQQQADELRAELEKHRSASETEAEKRVREAVDQAVADTTAKYERRLFEATVIARASGQLRDPEDAVRLLPLDELVKDPDKLDEALKTLLEQKPYLAAGNGQTTTTTSVPLVTQGVRGQRPPADNDDPDAWIRARARGARGG
jgi:hypothetical protein